MRSLTATSDEVASPPLEFPRLSRHRPFSLAGATHYTSLAAAAVVILGVGRNQWFFGDDWDFVIRRGLKGAELGLFSPHNEHWSTSPILVYRALVNTFGVKTYLPFLAAVVLLHIGVAHTVWRILLKADVDRWLATALVGTFLVNGAGSENLLWGFQIGFVGALFIGLVVLHLVNEEHLSRGREMVAVALSTLALTWAGVAVPVIGAAGIVSWMRRGRLAAVRLLAVPAGVYLLWLKLAGSQGLHSHQVTKHGLLLVPSYLWHGLLTSVEGYTFFLGGGPVILLVLAFVLVQRVGWAGTPAAGAGAASLGAVLLFLTVAPGRVALGLDQAGASRYQYLTWALLLPAIGVCLAELTASDHRRRLALIVLAGAVAVHGLSSLVDTAHNDGNREQALRRTIVAAAELTASGAPVFALPPHPLYAPDLAPPSRLVYLLRSAGLRRSRDITVRDRLNAIAALQFRLPPLASLPVGPDPTARIRAIGNATTGATSPGCQTVRPTSGRAEITLDVVKTGAVGITSSAGGELRVLARDAPSGQTADPNTPVTLIAGRPVTIDLALTTARVILLLPPAGDAVLCGVGPAL